MELIDGQEKSSTEETAKIAIRKQECSQKGERMNKREKKAAELLDERLSIITMPCSGPADTAMYDGMINMLRALGYDVVIRDNKHVVFDTKA